LGTTARQRPNDERFRATVTPPRPCAGWRSSATVSLSPAKLAFLQYARAQGTNSFGVSGTPGRKFSLERSSGLTTWTNLATLELVDNSGEVVFQEDRTNAPPAEFYRATLLP
jgi:hypothetical protein